MHITVKEGYGTRQYWLVSPTKDETQAYQDRPKWSRRANVFFGIGLLGSIVMVIGSGIVADKLTDNNSIVLATMLGVLSIGAACVALAFYCSRREHRWLDVMKRDGRALEMNWRYAMCSGEVGATLMRKLLFGGDRHLSTDHMQQVLALIEPHLIDQFLLDPYNREGLTAFANAATPEEMQAWYDVLAPSIQPAIGSAQSDIARLQAAERAEAVVDKVQHEADVAAGLHRVAQFVESRS